MNIDASTLPAFLAQLEEAELAVSEDPAKARAAADWVKTRIVSFEGRFVELHGCEFVERAYERAEQVRADAQALLPPGPHLRIRGDATNAEDAHLLPQADALDDERVTMDLRVLADCSSAWAGPAPDGYRRLQRTSRHVASRSRCACCSR